MAEKLGDTQVVRKNKLKIPRKYWVIFHNDDFTTQEFVIQVLVSFFFKNPSDAFDLMLKVHQEGQARVGCYAKDIAESKAFVATSYCREHEMPLLITCEPA